MQQNETFELAFVDSQRISETCEEGYLTMECETYTTEQAEDVLEVQSFRVLEDFSTLNLQELMHYLALMQRSETINMEVGEYFLSRDPQMDDSPLISFTDDIELESLMNCYVVVCTGVNEDPTHQDIKKALGEI